MNKLKEPKLAELVTKTLHPPALEMENPPVRSSLVFTTHPYGETMQPQVTLLLPDSIKGSQQDAETAVECKSPMTSTGVMNRPNGETLRREEKLLEVKSPATPIETSIPGLTCPKVSE